MINQYNVVLAPHTEGHPLLVKEQSTDYVTDTVNSPESVVDMVNTCTQLAWQAEEYVYMVSTDSAGHVLGLFPLAHGTVNTAPVGMRELAIRILLSGAIGITVLHNHPSGSVTPSKEDESVCRRIKQTCALLDIRLLDFIVVGRRSYYSFAEQSIL